jgi:hypothetical protein
MDVPKYRIHQILKVYTDRLKRRQTKAEKKFIVSSTFYDELLLPFDGKKKQMMNQFISESINQFTTVRERQERKIVDDVLHDIFTENGRRKQYGSPI